MFLLLKSINLRISRKHHCTLAEIISCHSVHIFLVFTLPSSSDFSSLQGPEQFCPAYLCSQQLLYALPLPTLYSRIACDCALCLFFPLLILYSFMLHLLLGIAFCYIFIKHPASKNLLTTLLVMDVFQLSTPQLAQYAYCIFLLRSHPCVPLDCKFSRAWILNRCCWAVSAFCPLYNVMNTYGAK